MKNNNIAYKILLFITMACLTASCAYEEDNGEKPLPPVPEGMVQIELFSKSSNFELPDTKAGAATETLSTTAPSWVFVFKGKSNNNNATFVEAQKVTYVNDKWMVTLTKSTEDMRLLVISNAPTKLNGFNLDAAGIKTKFTTSTTFTQAVNNILVTEHLPVGMVPYVPYAMPTPLPIPMSGVYNVTKIDDQTTIGNSTTSFKLNRILAKVTVKNTDPNFKLLAATIAKAPKYGRLYQLGTSLVTDNSATYASNYANLIDIAAAVDYTKESYQSTTTNPLYVYESDASNLTSVIVQGMYKGKMSFYKLGFLNVNQDAPMSIIRNKSYEFVISSVLDSGSGNAQTASSNDAQNISYTINIEDRESHDIIDNGRYYLAVSNSALALFTKTTDEITKYHALTLTTNADLSNVSKGISTSAGITVDNFNGGWIENGETSTNNIMLSFSPSFKTGKVTITIGSLIKDITIDRYNIFDKDNIRHTFAAEYVKADVAQGDEWLSVSDSMDPSTGQTSVDRIITEIYLHSKVSYSRYSSSLGIAYMSRMDDKGRLKIIADRTNYAINPIPDGYVGTFHKWNETEERIINMGNGSTVQGTWSAEVIDGTDFIILDNLATSYGPKPSIDNITRPVVGNKTKITGTCNSSTLLCFKVGLTGILESKTSKPRYGLVLLTYLTNTASPQYHLIYVRQGEEADYIMSTNEKGTTQAYPIDRPEAKRIQSSNLTDNENSTSTTRYAMTVAKAGNTSYPSQIGRIFQWPGNATGIFAWLPNNGITAVSGWAAANPGAAWLENFWEVCPSGYKRPNGVGGAGNPELKQSLWLSTEANVAMNTFFGYYADGYFDRNSYGSGITSDFTTGTGKDMGSRGVLFFNPKTNASVFFPIRAVYAALDGKIDEKHRSIYWTSTASGAGWVLNLQHSLVALDAVSINQKAVKMGGHIRCISKN